MKLKNARIAALLAIALLLLTAPAAISAASLERGRALFNDPAFAGGSKACNDCHVGGRGLEGSAKKKDFSVMGTGMKGLADVVNFCIENATGGTPIPEDSRDMKDIIEYIRSLSPVDSGARG